MKNKKRKEEHGGRGCHERDPFVVIPVCLAGIYMLIVLLVLLLDATAAPSLLVPVVWAFVVLGFFALMYAYQTHKIMKK